MNDPHEELLEQLRPAAFAVAYRMLGSVAEAEDVVQEALLRLHQELAGGEEIASPRAYLATVTTRLAIDELRSARVRRESYVGEWLPEPLVAAEPEEDPARQVEMADSLSYAFLLLLESLTPEERAVLLLHDVFDYGYGEVAEVVGKSEDNTRQLAVRARRHVEEGRPRFEGTAAARRELGLRFFEAAGRGDMEALEGMLARDVVLRGDGGGKVPALARAVHGVDHVARTLAAWFRVGLRGGGNAEPAQINGLPGLLLFDGEGGLISALSVEVSGDQVIGVNSVVNPEKLRHLGPVGDLRALLSGG
ncbi:MAG TPA: RNA polymerase sigma-70 factor [Solirubrobacterales bacterium]|nr:RNA polymerase sigma-70 factor [Solirubrobacterales bacterium]